MLRSQSASEESESASVIRDIVTATDIRATDTRDLGITRAAITATTVGLRTTEAITTLGGRTTTAATEFTGTTSIIVITDIKLVRLV